MLAATEQARRVIVQVGVGMRLCHLVALDLVLLTAQSSNVTIRSACLARFFHFRLK